MSVIVAWVVILAQIPCRTAGWEKNFSRLTASLFADHALLRDGSIVDCGANTGGESCLYATLDPTRLVHAIEPLLEHHLSIERYRLNRTNLLPPIHGGLGNVERIVETEAAHAGSMIVNLHRAPSAKHSSSTAFTIYRLDSLFSSKWSGERLAFAHFDVEGAEADVLAGGMETLKRDRPIFTVEVGYHDHAAAAKLFAVFGQLGQYDAYLVHEVSGVRSDLRNLVVIPSERPPASDSPLAQEATVVRNASHLSHVASTAPTMVRGVLCQGEPGVLKALSALQARHRSTHAAASALGGKNQQSRQSTPTEHVAHALAKSESWARAATTASTSTSHSHTNFGKSSHPCKPPFGCDPVAVAQYKARYAPAVRKITVGMYQQHPAYRAKASAEPEFEYDFWTRATIDALRADDYWHERKNASDAALFLSERRVHSCSASAASSTPAPATSASASSESASVPSTPIDAAPHGLCNGGTLASLLIGDALVPAALCMLRQLRRVNSECPCALFDGPGTRGCNPVPPLIDPQLCCAHCSP